MKNIKNMTVSVVCVRKNGKPVYMGLPNKLGGIVVIANCTDEPCRAVFEDPNISITAPAKGAVIVPELADRQNAVIKEIQIGPPKGKMIPGPITITPG